MIQKERAKQERIQIAAEARRMFYERSNNVDSQTRRERRKQTALRNAERDLKIIFERIDRRFDAREAAEAAKQEEAPKPPEQP